MKRSILITCFLVCSLIANAQIQNPVKWSYAAKKLSPTEAMLYIKATIDKGWHIYSVNQKDGGPQKTSFRFSVSKDYTLVGKIAEPKPIKKFEEVFGMDVMHFENSVVFTQKVKLNAKSTVVKGMVEFMACTNEQCLPPAEVEFNIPIQ